MLRLTTLRGEKMTQWCMAGVILTVTVRQVDFLDLIDTLVHTVMSTLRKQKI